MAQYCCVVVPENPAGVAGVRTPQRTHPATFWTFFYHRQWWIFFLYAATIAFSRISVGVHYPLDVLGGAVLGTALAFMFIFIILLPGRRIGWLRIPGIAQGQTPGAP